jgi:hypothetical protein
MMTIRPFFAVFIFEHSALFLAFSAHLASQRPEKVRAP